MPAKKTTGFGGRLKKLREAAGLTQVALGERTGLHSLTISKIELGLREPGWSTVQAISKALGLSCEAFADADPEDVPAPKPRGRPVKKAPKPRKRGK